MSHFNPLADIPTVKASSLAYVDAQGLPTCLPLAYTCTIKGCKEKDSKSNRYPRSPCFAESWVPGLCIVHSMEMVPLAPQERNSNSCGVMDRSVERDGVCYGQVQDCSSYMGGNRVRDSRCCTIYSSSIHICSWQCCNIVLAFSAELWCFWFIYLALMVLENHFPKQKYYTHACKLSDIMKITLQLCITVEQVHDITVQLQQWVEKYES